MSPPYTTLNDVHYNGSDHTNLNMPNTLLSEAAKLRNDSDEIFLAPYDFELPMMKSPKRTDIMFIKNMIMNCLVIRSSLSDEFSILYSLSCSN